jgi:hypothetical protein
VEADLFTTSWFWPSSLPTGAAVISDDDEAEDDVPDDDDDSASCSTEGFSSGKWTGQAGMGASLPGNTSMKDGGGGGGGSARTSTPRSSDSILEELRRNLEEVAGLTSLFSEDLLPPPAAAVALLLFFFLLPCPCCWLEFGEEAEESLVLSLPKLGLGGLVEAEVEVRCGSRRRGEWRSMIRLLLPPLPGVPVLATTEVASAEEQEMEMVGRPSRLCTPLRSRDAMDDGWKYLSITWELSGSLVRLVARSIGDDDSLLLLVFLSVCPPRNEGAGF